MGFSLDTYNELAETQNKSIKDSTQITVKALKKYSEKLVSNKKIKHLKQYLYDKILLQKGG